MRNQDIAHSSSGGSRGSSRQASPVSIGGVTPLRPSQLTRGVTAPPAFPVDRHTRSVETPDASADKVDKADKAGMADSESSPPPEDLLEKEQPGGVSTPGMRGHEGNGPVEEGAGLISRARSATLEEEKNKSKSLSPKGGGGRGRAATVDRGRQKSRSASPSRLVSQRAGRGVGEAWTHGIPRTTYLPLLFLLQNPMSGSM